MLPLFLANASPDSLAPTSALSLAQSLGAVVLGPLLVGLHHRAPFALVVIENACVVCGGIALWAATTTPELETTTLTRLPLFWTGLTAVAVDAAISSQMSVLVEKEYVRRLYSHCEDRLASANALLVRVDMMTSVATYTVLALAMRHGVSAEGGSLVAVLGGWHVLSAGAQVLVLARLRRVEPALAQLRSDDAAPPVSRSSSIREGLRAWAALPPGARQAVAAFMCLFFTVLSPSGLLSAHLRSRGVSAGAIASFRSAAQLAGGLGTLVAPRAIARFGAAAAAVWLQRLQMAAVGLAGVATWPRTTLWWPPSLRPHRELILMGAVATSRVGLWGFDLSERQLLQLAAPPHQAALLFSLERSLAEAAGLLLLLLSLAYSAPDDFYLLVALSVAAVATSTAILATGERQMAQAVAKRAG